MDEFQNINELCAGAVVKCEEALDGSSVDAQVARARLRAIEAGLGRIQ
jgi:hypothetical protein